MNPFADLAVEYVEWHLTEDSTLGDELTRVYGFEVAGRSPATAVQARSVALVRGAARFILTDGLDPEHPATGNAERHGDGVADIALSTSDTTAAYARAVAAGATGLREPQERDGCVVASIAAFGDVTHTFVQQRDPSRRHLPGIGPVRVAAGAEAERVDHVAVCLERGTLAATVEFYERVLGFEAVFRERIAVGRQAMDSVAVQSRGGAVTLTLIEPSGDKPGQIDDFLRDHGGAGVQHVAFSTGDIVARVRALRELGVRFLSVPAAYYDIVSGRVVTPRHAIEDLRELGVLLDRDHDGVLFQIFAGSTHPRRTVFFELVERIGARTFGSNNVRALYEAVERDARAGATPR